MEKSNRSTDKTKNTYKIVPFKKVNLENDFLFMQVMSNKDICRKVLEVILNIEIEKVVFIDTQEAIELYTRSKGIRMDVFAKDGKGTVYNVEMQRTDQRNIPKRSRYYQSAIDMRELKRSVNYAELRQSFVIFICTFDYFHKGRAVYTFKNECQEEKGMLFGDETTKVVLNTAGDFTEISKDLGDFLGYIERSTDGYVAASGNQFLQELHKEVKKIKENDEIGGIYMSFEEMLMERGAEERAEGRAEGIILSFKLLGADESEIITNLMRILNVDNEKAKELLEKFSN